MSALLKKAVADRTLSLRAVGLLAVIIREAHQNRRIPTQQELSEMHSEGAYAVSTAWKELHDKGYLTVQRIRVKGTIRTRVVLVPETGFPGSGASGLPYISTSTSDEVTNDSSLTNPFGVRDQAAPGPGRRSGVDHDFWAEEQSSGEGAVGRFPDDDEKQARLKAKYKRESTPRGGFVDKRKEKQVDSWNAPELVAEFAERVAVATTKVAQVNHSALRGTFAKWRREGATSGQIVVAMDRFFADGRNLHKIGQEFPLWKRFISYYQTNQVDVAVAAGVEKSGLDEMAEQVEKSGARLGKRRF